LVDACDSILEWRNFQQQTKLDSFFVNIGFKSVQKIQDKSIRCGMEQGIAHQKGKMQKIKQKKKNQI